MVEINLGKNQKFPFLMASLGVLVGTRYRWQKLFNVFGNLSFLFSLNASQVKQYWIIFYIGK
jgi:hypothetical protein